MDVRILSSHGSLLFDMPPETGGDADIRIALERAVHAGKHLRFAVLDSANLRQAELPCADLEYALLRRANLRKAVLRGATLARSQMEGVKLAGADLSEVNLYGADLRGADLSEANLTRANLTRANLTDVDFSGTKLTCANLSEANLTRANLADADLTEIARDFWSVLDAAPNEADQLYWQLSAGAIDGTRYEGVCGCLVGNIAALRGCHYDQLDPLKPDMSRPAERWSLGLRHDNKRRENLIATITASWANTWRIRHRGPNAGRQPNIQPTAPGGVHTSLFSRTPVGGHPPSK